MVDRYWRLMVHKKFHIIYMDLHHNRCVTIERYISLVLAVISTGSLAGLFISRDMQYFLGILLAIAQIVTAAKPYLPFQNRINEIEKDLAGLNLIYMDIEKDWLIISNGELTEKEINEKYYYYDKKWFDYDNKYLQRDSLPLNEKIREKATKEMNNYFDSHFNGCGE